MMPEKFFGRMIAAHSLNPESVVRNGPCNRLPEKRDESALSMRFDDIRVRNDGMTAYTRNRRIAPRKEFYVAGPNKILCASGKRPRVYVAERK